MPSAEAQIKQPVKWKGIDLAVRKLAEEVYANVTLFNTHAIVWNFSDSEHTSIHLCNYGVDVHFPNFIHYQNICKPILFFYFFIAH